MERRTIIAAVDLRAHTDEVIREAKRLASASGSDLLILHVVSDLESLYGYDSDHPTEAIVEGLVHEAKRKSHTLCEEYGATDLRVHYEVRIGVPWSEITDCAIHTSAAYVVVGTHLAGNEHRILGSTCNRVALYAPCPVLMVPPE